MLGWIVSEMYAAGKILPHYNHKKHVSPLTDIQKKNLLKYLQAFYYIIMFCQRKLLLFSLSVVFDVMSKGSLARGY